MIDKNKLLDVVIPVVLGIACVVVFCFLLRATVFAYFNEDEIILDDESSADEEIQVAIDDNYSSLSDSGSESESYTTDDIMEYLEAIYNADDGVSTSDDDNSSDSYVLWNSDRLKVYYDDNYVACVYDVSTLVCYYIVDGSLSPIYNNRGELVTYNIDLHCEEVYH